MSAAVCARVHIYIYILYTNTHMSVFIYMYIYRSIYIYVCMYLSIFIPLSIYHSTCLSRSPAAVAIGRVFFSSLPQPGSSANPPVSWSRNVRGQPDYTPRVEEGSQGFPRCFVGQLARVLILRVNGGPWFRV